MAIVAPKEYVLAHLRFMKDGIDEMKFKEPVRGMLRDLLRQLEQTITNDGEDAPMEVREDARG